MNGYEQGTVLLDRLRPDRGNVRSDLGDLSELAASIRANGVLQPLLVRPHGDLFVIVDGHRRHAAAVQAGVRHAPVLIAPARAARSVTAMMLAAAMHKQLDPLDQAKAFKALREHGMGTADIAKATGYSTGTVRDRLILLDLPPQAQAMVAARSLGITEAVSIAKQVKVRGTGTGRPRGIGPAHFTAAHPLANTARGICTHDGRRMVGQVACGPCWERAIRADALGQNLAPEVDEAAITRAMSGDPAALTLAELDVAVARMTDEGLSASQIAARLHVTGRTVERSRARSRKAAA